MVLTKPTERSIHRPATIQAEPAGETARRLGEEDFLRVLPLELLEFPKPVIAAINGAAIGVGVTMTLPCDLRIAADSAKLGLTFARLGLLPGLGSTHLLPRLVGPSRALELVLTARVIPAAEAAQIGLVSRVVPDAALQEEARALAGSHVLGLDGRRPVAAGEAARSPPLVAGGGVGLEPVRPLPPRLLAQRGPQRQEARVDRR